MSRSCDRPAGIARGRVTRCTRNEDGCTEYTVEFQNGNVASGIGLEEILGWMMAFPWLEYVSRFYIVFFFFLPVLHSSLTESSASVARIRPKRPEGSCTKHGTYYSLQKHNFGVEHHV